MNFKSLFPTASFLLSIRPQNLGDDGVFCFDSAPRLDRDAIGDNDGVDIGEDFFGHGVHEDATNAA